MDTYVYVYICTYVHSYMSMNYIIHTYVYLVTFLLLYCVHILCCVGYSWTNVDISAAFEPDTGLSKGSAVDAAFVTDDKVTVVYNVY